MAGRLAFRLFLVFLGMVAMIVFVCHEIYKEIALELTYHRQYGDAWQAEYEHYHGPLSHAHEKLAVASVCMMALAAIVSWLLWKLFRKPGRRRSRAR